MKSNLKERKSFLEMTYIELGFNISVLDSYLNNVQLVNVQHNSV